MSICEEGITSKEVTAEDILGSIFIDTELSKVSETRKTKKNENKNKMGKKKNKKSLSKLKIKGISNVKKKRIIGKGKIESERNDNELSSKERNLTKMLFGETPSNMDEDSGVHTMRHFSSPTKNSRSFSVDTFAMLDKTDTVDDASQTKKQKKAAWVDEEENTVRLKDVAASYSKAKGSRGKRETSDARYKDSLTEMFMDVYGDTPDWAKLGRNVDEDEDDDSMARSTSTFLASTNSLLNLPKTTLDYKVIPDLNDGSYREGTLIRALDFCPQLGMILVGGSVTRNFGSVSLFQFSGKKNHKIKSIMFPNFPVHSAKFLPYKNQFVVSSRLHGRLFVYDIQEANKIDVPNSNIGRPKAVRQLEVSPDGKYMASISSGGWVHFLDSCAFSVVESTRIPAEINDLVFHPSSTRVYIHSDSGKVFIFDLTTWTCTWAFHDDGCVEGTSIAISPDATLLACGSSSGIVNIYDLSSVMMKSSSPAPLKVIKSLVTPVTSLAFNPSSEILAVASSFKENAFKLVHTKSMTVFANFPGPFNLNRIETVQFSPDGKFLLAGNNKKSAILCRLLHY